MTISATGSFVTAGVLNNYNVTAAVAPSALGDILVVFSMVNPSGTAFPINSIAISGGGVTTWHLAIYGNPGTQGNACAIHWGVITSTGSATVTQGVAADGKPSVNKMAVQQFTGSPTPVWAQDGSGGINGNLTGTSGNYPSLSPTGSNELYLACGFFVGQTIGGATSGFTYKNATGSLSPYAAAVWNTNAPSPSSPAWTAGSGQWCVVSAILSASSATMQIVMLL